MRTAVRKNSFAKVLRLGFLTVLLSVLLCMAMPWAVFAGEQRVFDNAKLFDASEKEALEQKLSSFREEWQMDLGVLLVDARHNPTMNDCTMAAWFRHAGCPFVVVANKLDKLKKSEIQSNLNQIRLDLELPQNCPVIPFSAEKGTGREELLSVILQAVQK